MEAGEYHLSTAGLVRWPFDLQNAAGGGGVVPVSHLEVRIVLISILLIEIIPICSACNIFHSRYIAGSTAVYQYQV